jgi:ribosomal protein S8
MEKTYQPFIITKSTEIIEYIKSKGFFEDFKIKSDTHAQQLLCDMLTARFIEGKHNESDDIVDIFPEVNDLLIFLSDIVTLESLDSLIKNGYVESLEDENNETFYFATEKGKEYRNKILDKK